MAKRTAPKKKSSSGDSSIEESVLPAPRPLLDHHVEVMFRAMTQWREQGKVPPVLLITGISGSGKREICHYLAQWLLCDRSGFGRSKTPADSAEETEPRDDLTFDMFGASSTTDMFGAPTAPAETAETAPASTAADGDEPAPCGTCPSCRRALDGNWVDFTEIAPEATDDGRPGTLKIEQFRELKQSQGFGAHEGPFRITLILDADRMTPQSANSLLKLLEEPPPGWVMLLTASDSSLLLPTLVSRCQRLRLRPLSERALLRMLEAKGIPSGRREICARLAQGSWRKALRLCDEDQWDRRKSLFRFLREPETELSALVDWASAEPANFDLMLDQMEAIVSDLVGWSAHGAATYLWVNSDNELALRKHAESAARHFGGDEGAREFWLECFRRVSEVRKRSAAPLNRKLLAQEVLFPWVEIG